MEILSGDFLLIFVLKKKNSDKEILGRLCVYWLRWRRIYIVFGS